MKYVFIWCHSIFTSIDPDLENGSLALVLHNTANLAKFTKSKIPLLHYLLSNALQQSGTPEKGNGPPTQHFPTKWIPHNFYHKVPYYSAHYSTTNISYEKCNTAIHHKYLKNNQQTITTTWYHHSTQTN